MLASGTARRIYETGRCRHQRGPPVDTGGAGFGYGRHHHSERQRRGQRIRAGSLPVSGVDGNAQGPMLLPARVPPPHRARAASIQAHVTLVDGVPCGSSSYFWMRL